MSRAARFLIVISVPVWLALLLAQSALAGGPESPTAITPIQDATAPESGKKRITFETLLSGSRPNLTGMPESGRWYDDEHYLISRRGAPTLIHARSGETKPFHEPQKLAQAIAALPEIDDAQAANLARLNAIRLDSSPGSVLAPRSDRGPLLSPGRDGVVFDVAEDLYYAALDGDQARRLTSTPGEEEFAEFSADGKFVAFVRDFDLYVVDVEAGAERRLTTGGSDLVRHAKADWVYFEEIFNRTWKAYWWSPDSRHIAFLEFDDTPVGTHVVLNDSGSSRVVEETRYPRAGDPNPRVRLGVVPVAGGPVAWADLDAYSPDAFLISNVGWFDGESAYCYAQDRVQTWLDLVRVGTDGSTSRLFRDATIAWIENAGNVIPLKDGGFLFPSERTGFKHIYKYTKDGSSCNALTSGEWEVRAIERLDEDGGWLYFTATKDHPRAENLYRVRLDGGDPVRLTRANGDHSVSVSPDASLFLDTWSDPDHPAKVALFETDGNEVRIVDTNEPADLKVYRLAPRERVEIPMNDGFVLEAELILPHEIDPVKKYPVWLMTYGGPHTPTIRESWAGGGPMVEALASEGFVVFRIDPRSATGKGARSAHAAYKRLGVQELADIQEAIAWLKEHKPFVDGARIGMAGHSYGGYLTAYCMTHSDLFAAGIAGAPVTDWRDYDSIYTERFMLTPQENPEGYRVSSVVEAAADLKGRLLILHGAIDDNVSVRNTMRLVQALQRADKDFELMIYPSARHGIFGPHYNRIQIEFIKRTLGGPKPQEE